MNRVFKTASITYISNKNLFFLNQILTIIFWNLNLIFSDPNVKVRFQ
jgi:hypothetical protein